MELLGPKKSPVDLIFLKLDGKVASRTWWMFTRKEADEGHV